MGSKYLFSALLAGVSAFAFAASANAQATNTQSTSSEIVVTGSRVIQNGNNSPTPVSVVSVNQLEDLKPGPIAEVISELPTLAGSRISTSNPGSGTTNAVANALNLRQLGYQRDLVMFDGARIAPSTYDQIVDTAMIPQMLLQRVDIVTGGVSAVYGSDAISGVVNFITDSKFNGLKVNGQIGTSNYNDDHTVDAGIAVGRSFLDGKLHVEASYEYNNDPGIMWRTARAWGQEDWSESGAGTAAAPYHLTSNTRYSAATFGGLISGAAGAGATLNGMTFAQNGALSAFQNGASSGTVNYQSGGSGAVYDGSLKAQLHTSQVFGRADYDFTDNIHGFVEGTVNFQHSLSYANYNNLNALTFSGQNAFLPAQDQFAGTFKLSEYMSDMSRIDTNTNENQSLILAGLNGAFGDGYKWTAAYTHSAVQSTVSDDNNISTQRLYAALDATTNSSGQTVCRASLTNSAYANCVPLDVFGPTAASSAALAYITQPTQYTVNNGLDDLSVSVSGAPIKDWAGPISVALSGEFRRQTFALSSTATPSQLANCTSLTYNCTATTSAYLDGTLANRPQVSDTVSEGAFETEIPVVRDHFLFQDLSINGAARYTDYSTSGGVVTWKAGLTWQVTDEWKIRATRSRDIRAPTLYDLYQPAAVNNNAQVTDYLVLTNGAPTTYTATTISGGNPNLKPEDGDTTTAGFVYKPNWLPRFSFSVDAYYIDISNAIVQEQGTLPTTQTYCYLAPTSSAFCKLQVRALGNYTNTTTANEASTWYTETINISDFKTYGADFEANYAATLFGNPLTLRGLANYNPHVVSSTPGSAPFDYAGGATVSLGGGPSWSSPIWRATLLADYKLGNFDVGGDWRYRSGLLNAQTGGGYIFTPNAVAPQSYFDMNFKYHLRTFDVGSADLFLNIQNLFNTQPQPYAGTAQIGQTGVYGGFAPGDDAIGRYFTMGFRFRH